jgi:hypothetical protein
VKRRTFGQYSPADQPLIRIGVEWDESVDEIALDLIAEVRQKIEALRQAEVFGHFPDMDEPSDLPRPLTARERAVLDFLLTADVPDVEVLRIQAQTARVTGYCGCGCPSITLEVDRESAPQSALGDRLAVETHSDPEDPEDTLWLFLWTRDGWLSYLEISWISEASPHLLPTPESLQSFEPPFEGGSRVIGHDE